ncbi:hypothetical protein HC752_23510 [Vibrio sp. S9_S30]|uniref:hypothetical protein n=1 Tax=Vibrio sp. S9_S30 TaxID=2720226 RepID=UPI0016818D9D|nr:hypothetical protein [Vibrio sp. S9_S30]MBD1559895.1 hypothetical protein [Vibrio sp. S9_S30]
MYKKIVGVVILVGIMSGCVNRDKIYANPPQELVEYVDRLMPEAEKFVNENESIALENGIPLTDKQLTIAAKVGVKSPKKIRVFYVNELPSPKDPELSALAKKYDYSSPNMAAYTYGHGIWIKKSYKYDMKLLSHELIHVRQSEQRGKSELTKQYLLQLFIYGYRNTPLEVEAYNEEGNYI